MSDYQKKYFISFADSRMQTAIQRIAKQAEDMNFFDEIHVMDENSLDPEFRKQWEHILRFDVRGYGYWLWKPYIILRLLEKMPENGVLLYCDAGCHLNPKGIERLHKYVDELNADKVGIKAFTAQFPHLDVIERRWTKGDVFDYFKCRNRKDVTDTVQVAAGHIFIRKCESTVSFMKEWIQVWYDNLSLLNDSRSKSKNLPGFIENRHDQSVFSVLYKLRGGTPFPPETDDEDFSNMEAFPIWDKRDRGYKDMRFFARLKRLARAKKIMTKVKIEKLKLRYFNKSAD